MISIIIPVYNVENYIEECLKSIFNQTYKNIEVIIVNDGSTDRSKNIIEKFKLKYKNIIYLEQENKGVSEARNLGLRHAKGEYVMYIDSDDYMEINMIEEMYSKAKSLDYDIVICGHIKKYDHKPRKDKIRVFNIIEKDVYTNEDILGMMLEFKVNGFVWDKLFKRQQLIENKFYFQPNMYFEDWIPVMKQIYSSKKIGILNKPLYYYRQRETSLIHKKNEKILNDYFYTINSIYEYISKLELTFRGEQIKVFYTNTLYTLIRYYYLYYYNSKKDLKQLYSFFKRSKYNEWNKRCKHIFIINKSDKIVLVKILLWKMKVFHMVYPK
ncbi:glycosyltransferase family 2 protein [Romboutsia lituseburensis]|uniref:Glycosyl transferase family 2 n=1 Tax=Romboutsia lituseburensis DSM 797 TaxID=1121325 RepID=A0A1G9PHR6_9FIRM|nr:glycosyltransferase family 2 protein [Romboutsia lituseburensis]CEH33395.1 Glycosyl transferase 2 [Romboutsia lituseburensis]SDL98338.1 Glycosyl transferase family 2 [Romboutsia lituseburensis DSM 797]